MIKKTIKIGATFMVALLMTSCNVEAEKETTTDEGNVEVVETLLTKEDQDAMTPDSVIQALKDGNQNFVNNDLTSRDHSAQIRKSSEGQYPKAIILSCVDSRVPVEDVFDKGIGDLFVARVAGNIVNEDILGSMEYACKVAGSKAIMVLGHEHCGAVKSAIADVKLGNITPLLAKIKPSIEKVTYDGERNNKNKEFVHEVCESNVRNTIENIRAQSPVLKEMEDNGEIKIVGAIYDMDNGKVDYID